MVGYAEKGATMFQYYLKIVPTLFAREEDRLFTNQYSVTRHQKVVSLLSGRHYIIEAGRNMKYCSLIERNCRRIRAKLIGMQLVCFSAI